MTDDGDPPAAGRGAREEPRDADPARSPTLADPDQVATVDGLGGKARTGRDRDATLPAGGRGAGEAAPARSEPPRGSAPEGDEARTGIEVGRYRLLELVGTSALGVVWGAWDPELERRVALKLVRPGPLARARMLREGQVLARLSHPNVVPVFDVGELGEQVYLVMEWVRGATLGAFADEAPDARAVLDAYREAGQGLDAAHRAGVVHRAFGPDAAIRGDDGRVRVRDFGLAGTGDASADPALHGAPGLTAPELARGGTATAASDQYAFCAALGEALERAAGRAPAWIAAIVERGTATDPDARFPSMRELLAALERDPARRRRRAALGLAVVAAAAGAFALGRSRASGPAIAPIEPCTRAAAELAGDWSAARRDRVTAHVRGLGLLWGADAGRLGIELDAVATAWIAEDRRACLAHERKELTAPLYGARLACLARTRAQLAAVAELLGEVDAAGLGAAVRTARSLPDVHACADDTAPLAPVPAPAEAGVRAAIPRVERARIRAAAGRPGALADAAAARAASIETGYAPLIARAVLAEGHAARIAGDAPRARTLLDKAWRLALAAHDEPTAVEAYARWIDEGTREGAAATGPAPGAATALEMWPIMDALAERLGARGRFPRALLHLRGALPRIDAGDRAGARELLRRGWAIAGGDPELELLGLLEQLAALEPDPGAAEHYHRTALARRRGVLGTSHPDALIAQLGAARLVRDREAARAEVEDACRALERWPATPAYAECALEAAWLADESDAAADAAAWMARVSSDAGPRGAIARAYLAVAAGAADEAARLAALGPLVEPAGHPLAGDALTVRALAAERRAARGGAAEVDRAWERVVAALLAPADSRNLRRLARARRVLAERWAESQPRRARELARDALAWYRGVPSDTSIAARLERIAGPAPR